MNSDKIINKLVAGVVFPPNVDIDKTTFFLTGKQAHNSKFGKKSAEYEDEHLSGHRIWVLESGSVLDEENNIIGNIPKNKIKSAGNKELEGKYKKIHGEILNHLKTLEKKMIQHDKEFIADGSTNYGYLGDLGKIDGDLKEILEFLG